MKTLILVVEDNPANLYLISYILEKHNYQVVTAENGTQAIKTALEKKPDLILMDMQLPEISGYDAAKQIKKQLNPCKTAIVALTAYALKGDREKAFLAGCDYYIEKPIDPETFVHEIEAFLREYDEANTSS